MFFIVDVCAERYLRSAVRVSRDTDKFERTAYRDGNALRDFAFAVFCLERELQQLVLTPTAPQLFAVYEV